MRQRSYGSFAKQRLRIDFRARKSLAHLTRNEFAGNVMVYFEENVFGEFTIRAIAFFGLKNIVSLVISVIELKTEAK